MKGTSKRRRQIAASSPRIVGRWFAPRTRGELRVELELVLVEEPRGDPIPAGHLLHKPLIELTASGSLGGADKPDPSQAGYVGPRATRIVAKEGLEFGVAA